MVQKNRVDFTIWSKEDLADYNKEFNTQLVSCGETAIFTHHFYTYLHPDFAYMQPWIEEKYLQLQQQGIIGHLWSFMVNEDK